MGIFRTKLDFSDNRQVKQRIETTTNLSGATTFGVPFGDLPNGPNLTLSSVTQTFDNISSTFSGNLTTTIFTWGDTNMGIADSVFSAITPSNSGDTQASGNFYVPDVSSFFNIDGNTGYTQYSGVSYDIQITDMIDLGGGNYSGEVFTFLLEYISTTALDFTGRTIWNDVSGITRTNRLIITDNPMSGYVWTCIDSEGMGEWQYNGSSSASTLFEVGSGSLSTQRKGASNNSSGDGSFTVGSGNTASGNYSSIIGGTNNTNSNISSSILAGTSHLIEGPDGGYNAIIGGSGNTISDDTINSVIVGGNNLILSKNNTVMVPNLIVDGIVNIRTIGTGTPVINLGLDASGNVVTGSSGSTLSEVLINGNTTGNKSIHVEDGYGIGSIVPGATVTTGVQFNNFDLTIQTSDSNLISPTYGSSEMRFTPTGLTIGTVAMVGSSTFRGVEYEQDYSANYTNRSLVDKEYVDNQITGYTGNTLEQVLTNGNTTGPNDIIVESGNTIFTERIKSNLSNSSLRYNLSNPNTVELTTDDGTYGDNSSWFFGMSGNSTQVGYQITSTESIGLGAYASGINPILGTAKEIIISDNRTNTSNSGNFDKRAILIGTRNSTIASGVTNSVVLGGVGISATNDDTVYTPNLIVNTGGTASRLGINTDSPQYVLDIHASTGNFFFSDSIGGLAYVSGTTGLPRFQVSAGVGGVGTGAGGTIGMRAWDDVTYTPYGQPGDMHIYAGISSNGLNLISADGSGGGAEDYIRFYAGRSANMGGDADIHIHGTGATKGFIGLGTENPLAKLDVNGNTRVSGNGLFYTNIDGTTENSTVISGGTTALTFFEAKTIDSSSIRFGVRGSDMSLFDEYGKTNDSFLYSSINSNGLNLISADGIGTEDYIRFYAGQNAEAVNTSDIHIHGTGLTRGYVGIGIEQPTAKLHVSGNGRFETIGSSASAGALHYTADGTLTTNTSDERLKTNITTLTGALDKVNQLRGVSYNWVENPTGDTRIGFIAQEVNSVVPELAFTNPNSPENYMGVHYDNVTALLVEAMKELAYGVTITNNTYLETQTILAEDNNIELNYSGTPETAIGGGITILHALGVDNAAEFVTDNEGNFVTNNDFKPQALTIPLYTPTSSNDTAGSEGNITRDDNFLYIKTSSGWKRTNLENF